MPTNSITVNVQGHLKLQQQLQLLNLPPAKRRRLLATINRKVIRNSRQRLRSQTDLSGRSFTPRKGKGKRKMLAKMMRANVLRIRSTDELASITWKHGLTAQIAYRHQEGVPETMTARRMAKIHGQPDYDADATRLQAVALREEGFTIKGKGKRRLKPGIKWITSNLSLGQAGAILRLMRDKKAQSQWTIPVPARSFLGMTPQDITQTADELLQSIRKH